MGSALLSIIASMVINDTLGKVAGGIGSDGVVMVYANDLLFVGDFFNFGRVMQAIEFHLGEMPFTIEREERCAKDKNRSFIRFLEIGLESRKLFARGSKDSYGSVFLQCGRISRTMRRLHCTFSCHTLGNQAWNHMYV